MRRTAIHALGGLGLLALVLLAPRAFAEDLVVTSPRAGTYRPGQHITVQWKPVNAPGSASLRLVSRSGKRRILLMRRAAWLKTGVRVEIPRDVPGGEYTVEVSHGLRRGWSGLITVRGPAGPDASESPSSAERGDQFPLTVTRPGTGTHHLGETLTVEWEGETRSAVDINLALVHPRIREDYTGQRLATVERGGASPDGDDPSEPASRPVLHRAVLFQSDSRTGP